MSGDPFAPIDGAKAAPIGAGSKSFKPAWSPVLPVPANAPAPPVSHYKLGKPTARWTYADATGAVIGYVHRFDTADGKVFRPLVYMRPSDGGAAKWRWESWPAPRPLYGLRMLAERPSAPAVVCEGEKSADAAAGLLPAMAAVTSPNGSKSAGRADWSPLRGRAVTIWPDADTAGLEYATEVAKQATAAGAASVAIISPPSGCKVGWDAADALAEHWDQARAAELVAAAQPPGGKPGIADDDAKAGGRRRGPPQRDVLIGFTDACEFWHDANRTAFVTFPVNAHREHWPVRSRDFRMWLASRFYGETEAAIGVQAIEDSIRVLEARAVNDGPEHEAFVRVGHQGGKLYLDLGDPRWRAVEISADAHKVIDTPSVKLLRTASMRALPDPDGDSAIDQFRRFINVSDDDFTLVVAWLVAALRHRGPFPILVVAGEQGSGKSMFSRMIRALVDPSAAPIRSAPKDDRDLIVSATNSWVLAYDNLSMVAEWLSDGLCRLATGGGFATRMLHTDRDEMIFEGQRPIILNGIPLLTSRADLADRAVTIHLRAIPEHERQPEDILWAEFEAKRPAILAALLVGASSALRHVGSVRLERSPRMADFAKWAVAAEPGLGWEPNTFLAAYNENRRDVAEASFEADGVAVAMRDFVASEHPSGWEGTPTELLAALNLRVAEGIRKARSWPLTAQGLGNRVDRAAPLLRNKGFAIGRRHSKERTIVIMPPPRCAGET